jgi:hypothetical protein
MPLLQYFGWVGSFLVAALFAASWCISAPIGPATSSDVPLDQKINIRIHTDHRWPERVVFDTSRSTLSREPKGDAETDVGGNEAPAQAEGQPFDAFAEMAAIPTRPCFQRPCSTGHALELDITPIDKSTPSQNHLRTTARKSLTFPNPLRRPPEKS